MTVLNRDDLTRIVIPTVTEIVVCITLSVIILVGINIGTLFAPLEPYISVSTITGLFQSWISFISNIAGTNTVVVVLFWGILGITVYAICWAIINALTHTYNEAVVETEFVNKGTALEQLSPEILQLIFGIALVGGVLISAWLVGTLVQAFALTLLSWTPIKLVAEFGEVMMLALALYVLRVLAQITFYID